MSTNKPRRQDFPKPAPPDAVAGRDGAASSSSGEGPLGKGGGRKSAAPRISKCDHPDCGGGVFTEKVDDRAYLRDPEKAPYVCQTCRAAPHWERSAVKSARYRLEPPKAPQGSQPFWDGLGVRGYRPERKYRVAYNANDIEAGDPNYKARDLDGTLIPDLLGQRRKNHGRKRTYGFRKDGVTPAGRRNKRLLRSGDGGWVDIESDENAEFFERGSDGGPIGGFFVERAGTTGQPQGRPPRGTSEQPWAEIVQLAQILWLDEPGKMLLGAVVGLDKTLNVKELATKTGIGKSSIYRWVGKNLPKGGSCPDEAKDDGVSAAAIESKLDEMREQLSAQMRGEHEELVRILFAFRYGETPVEAWERLLSEADAEAA